jgi:HAD superfamily hydrolase (TIGR01509 family)
MTKKYKAVLFDLDGTLVKTRAEYRYDVIGRVLNELGVKYSNQQIDDFWFRSHRDNFVQSWVGENNAEKFWHLFRSYDQVDLRKDYAEAYNDIEFLKEVRKKKLKIGVITGAPQHIAKYEIGLIGCKPNFYISANSDYGIKPKPHPQGLNMALKSLGLKPSEVIFVGNGEEDVLASKAAKIYSVIIDRGENIVEESPSLRITSLYELRNLLGF